ncbi:hypothetical protein BD289DRAFT_83585 [Coniella lustricola]|uniref:Uncharacterized protein n=1 Tax=Coniella lustricola TaxID=2025994 RepID=A0A2T3AHC9_9PEZI|nr:hypothetical protein BD289DRAFT_83585 [Coniella lustricola]
MEKLGLLFSIRLLDNCHLVKLRIRVGRQLDMSKTSTDASSVSKLHSCQLLHLRTSSWLYIPTAIYLVLNLSCRSAASADYQLSRMPRALLRLRVWTSLVAFPPTPPPPVLLLRSLDVNFGSVPYSLAWLPPSKFRALLWNSAQPPRPQHARLHLALQETCAQTDRQTDRQTNKLPYLHMQLYKIPYYQASVSRQPDNQTILSRLPSQASLKVYILGYMHTVCPDLA